MWYLAQTLLEEANQLQTTHDNQLTNLYSFIPNITQPHLWKCLGNPELVYPKPQTQVICCVPQISSTTIPPPVQPPIVSTLRPNPTPRTTSIWPWTMIRCFKCGSPDHIKWYCPQYRCHGCRQLFPGHAFQFCPEQKSDPSVSHYGYYNNDGPDGSNFGRSN